MFLRKSEAKNEDSQPSSGPFFKPRVQLKLKIGESNDRYEQEADRVASQVVNNTKGDSVQKKNGDEEVQQKPIASQITPYSGQTSSNVGQKKGLIEDKPVQKAQEEADVQRQETGTGSDQEEPVQKMAQEEEPVQKKDAVEEESVQKAEEEEPVQKKEDEEPVQMAQEEEPVQKAEEEEPIQKKEDEEPVQMMAQEEEPVQKAEEEEPVQTKEEEEPVQKKAGPNSSQSTSIENRLNSSKGGGQKLGGKAKNEMESGFGADFSNVNIHTDQNAVQMSEELGAKAFAHGNDVYFNKGQYNPESSEGKHLLAHELTHTIQQKGMVQKEELNSASNAASSANSEPNFDIEIGFNAFIPNTLNAPVYEDNKAWKREPDPFSDKLFSSDNRSYSEGGSSRIWQKGTLKFKGTDLISRTSQQGVGASEQADPVYKIIGYTPIHYGSDTGGNPIKEITGIKNKTSKTAADKGSVSNLNKGEMRGFNFVGEASYPFSMMAPDIDFNISALIQVFKKDNEYYAAAILTGVRDNFPAYQAYISSGGKKDYFYTYRVDKNDGPGLFNLNSSTIIVASKFIKL